MLFDPEEIPKIRQRLEKGMGPAIMAHLRRDAERGITTAAGLYFILTGDPSFADEAVLKLITSAWRTPQRGVLRKGRHLFDIAMGYDLLYNFMTPDQRETVRSRVDELAQEIYLQELWHMQGYWLPQCMGAVAIAGLALQEENRYADSWILRGRVASLKYLYNTFDPEGAPAEAICRYLDTGMKNVLILAAAERRQGRDYFTYRNNIFNRLVEFAAYTLVPYEHQSARPIDWHYFWLPFDDTFAVSSDPPAIFAAIAGLTKDPLAQWVFEATAPATPEPYVGDPILAAAFYDPEVPIESPDVSKRLSLAKAYRGFTGTGMGQWSSGHVFLRTGFGNKDQVMFAAQCGDSGGWHGHSDQSGFFLYAYGDRLVMDPATIGKRSDPLFDWMKGPEAHSIVTIDGQAYPLYRLAEDLEWPHRFLHSGEVDGFVHTETLDFVSMDFGEGLELNPNISKVKRGKRYVLFFRHPNRHAYVVIVDDVIQDSKPHRYEWLLQPDDKHKIVKEASGQFAFEGVPARGRGFEFSGLVDLKIRMIAPQDPEHMVALAPHPGYLNYLRVRSRHDRVRGLFFTVLYPKKKEDSMPTITEIRQGNVIGAKIGQDIVLFNRSRAVPIDAAGVESDGELVALRISDGAISSAIVVNGRSLRVNGKDVPFVKPASQAK